ncbi:FUSC family protein [soil metagenome]
MTAYARSNGYGASAQAVLIAWARALPTGAEAFFSLKSFIAAMLAYYIALRIGLNRPYWAIITCYIVAQPLAGAVLSKAVFRMIGTAIGGTVAIILVPNLVSIPELLSLALALWLGLCTYVSLLDRTPRSYIALLAGYTAGIIGFPAVSAPDTIFTIASLRVQEIVIGIIAATVVHGLFLPKSVTARLRVRVGTILSDAERWSRDALAADNEIANLDRDRRRLAIDLHELHQLAVHVPYDTAGLTMRVDLLRALEDQLALLLPLASAIEDRLLQLRKEGWHDPAVRALIEDVRTWLSPDGDAVSGGRNAEDMIRQARNLEPVLAGVVSWSDVLRLSLLDRLAELVETHAACRQLRQTLDTRERIRSPKLNSYLRLTARRPLHSDHGIALRGAVGTALTVVVGCAFWITTAWPEGAGAVVIASIVCALFSNLDEPGPVAWRVFYGTLVAVGISAVYAFAILPRVTDIVTLIAVLAPFFLLLGVLQARPKTAPFAVGLSLSFPGIVGLNEYYDGAFATFGNTAIAQLLGVLLAVIMLGLVRTMGAEAATRRLVRAGWRDLANRTNNKGIPDTSAWISQMLDRIGLLTPQLLSIGLDPAAPLMDVLADTRVGISVDELRRFRATATGRDVALSTLILRSVREHFRARALVGPADVDPVLVGHIDLGLAKLGATSNHDERRQALLALTSLRRNLAPDAPSPVLQRNRRKVPVDSVETVGGQD